MHGPGLQVRRSGSVRACDQFLRCALKVIGVEGEMLPNHAGQVTQDFVFNNASTFAANADDFLNATRLRADPEALKRR